MPVLDLLERANLIKNGIDPDTVSRIRPLAPDETVEEPVVQQPTSVPTSTLEVSPKKTSWWGAGIRESIRGIPGAATGLAAGSATAEALSPAAAIPYIGPAIPLVGGLGVGAIAAMLERYGQTKAMEKIAPNAPIVGTEQEKLDTSEHPTATLIGGMASQLPFMGVASGKNLLGAGRAVRDILKKPITQEPINNLDFAALKNMAIGATAPVGQEYAQEAYNQGTLAPKLDAGNIALSALGGAALSRPRDTGINKLLGLHPTPDRQFPLAGLKEKQRTGQNIEPIVEAPVEQQPEVKSEEPPVNPLADVEFQSTEKLSDMLNFKSLKDLVKEKQATEKQTLQPSKSLVEQHAQATDNLAKEEQAIVEDIKIKNQQAEELRLQREAEAANKIKEDNAFTEDELNRAIKTNQGPKEDNFNPKTNPQKTNTKAIEEANLESAQTPLSEGEQIQSEYDKGIRYQPKGEIETGAIESGVKTTPTKQWMDAFKKLGSMRNVRVDDSGRVFDASGKEIAGKAAMRQGLQETLAKINPNKAGLDTAPHEIFHPFFGDLETHGSKADKQLVAEARAKYFGEEPLTTSIGSDVVRRVLATDKKGDFKNWLADFWSHVKRRFGNATNEDYTRILSSRLINDPTFNDSFGKGSIHGGRTNDEKLQREGEIAGKEASAVVPEGELPERGRFSLLKFQPEIDKVNKIASPKAPILAKAMTKFYENLRANRGAFVNKFIRPAKSLANIDLTDAIKNPTKAGDVFYQNSEPLKNVLEHLNTESEGGVGRELTPKEQEIKDLVKELQRDVHQAKVDRPAFRIKAEDYNEKDFPHIPANKVLDTIQENPEASASRKLIKDFLDYHEKNAPADIKDKAAYAQHELDSYFKSWSNKFTPDIASKYPLMDNTKHVMLPPSWRETNLMSLMNRHLDRVARRLAYHDAFETNPEAKNALETLRSNKIVQGVLDNITGVHSQEEDKRAAAAGVVKSSMLGTFTGTKDLATSGFQSMQHQENPIQTVKSIVHSWSNMKKNIVDSFDTGVNRANLNAIEWHDDAANTLSLMRRVRDVMSEVQARNWLEQITRAHVFGIGRYTTMDFAAQLAKGKLSKAGEKFFKDFGEGVDLKDGHLTPEDIKKIAARFVESNQGTYDYRGQPKIAMEGTWAPMLGLARWNIEKANNFSRYVVNPALKGNVRPLIMATLGGILNGAGIVALTQAVTGRKQKTATLDELSEASKEGKNTTKAWMYKAAGLASAAGYAGILGDLTKGVMDITYAKNRPQTYNNVLLQAGNNVGTTVANWIRSVNDNGFQPAVAWDAISQILEDNIQAYRIILSHASDEKSEDVEKSNKLRDLRTFHTLRGDDVNDLTTSFNRPFKHELDKQFKNTQDIGEAGKMLPTLLKRAFEKAGNDPEKLDKELTKLKENNYQTFPSMDNAPLEFAHYFNWLKETQGEPEARKRLGDYMKRNLINEVKSDLIP